MTTNDLYDYSPITERGGVEWPDGKKLAFYIGLNIEHFHVDQLAMGAIASTPPDPMTYGKRDYGNRVGIWRMMELFDEVGLRASAITNSEVCEHYPQIIEAGVARNWCWVGHGLNNSMMHTGYSEEEESEVLDTIVESFAAVVPNGPKGWLGPGLTETFNTPRLLRERGFTYLLDWCADDVPFHLNIPGMVSVPYSLSVNDISMFESTTFSASSYAEMVLDQFEVLLSEGGRVMALPIHPFVIAQPYRFKHFARAIREITSHPDVWVTTAEDIANHFIDTTPSPQTKG